MPGWATCDPYTVNGSKPHTIQSICGGKWIEKAASYVTLIDPMNGDKFMSVPNTTDQEVQQFIASSQQCPKSGLHNMFKRPERYVMWGDLCFKIAQELRKPEVEQYFARLIQRVMLRRRLPSPCPSCKCLRYCSC